MKIAIIGELVQDSFSQKLLYSILEEVGIKLEDCYFTTADALQSHNVIVAMGEEPLVLLCSKTKIHNWRGSILETPYGKVIPVIHPKDIFKDWSLRPACVADFRKIKENAEFKEIRRKKRTLITNPSFKEIMDYAKKAKKEEWLAFDIETETEQITCIGLATSDIQAICIPFWFGASGSLWSKEEEIQIWEVLKDLLETETPKKIAQNGMYDIEFLTNTVGIKPTLHFDTMLGFHTLYSELPLDLGFLNSLYTDISYYKDKRTSSTMATLWEYNALDAIVTYECAMSIMEELNDLNLMEFYATRVHSLINPLLAMQSLGVRFDCDARDRLRKQYRYDISLLQHDLEKLVGYPLNVSSPKQMQKWLYEEHKFPSKTKLRKATGKETVTSDDEALWQAYKTCKDEVVKEAFDKIFEIREKSKILSTYLDVKLDKDKRIRCSYSISGTETGRLSSKSTSRQTGTNLQNIPSGIVKRLFLADEGKLLINADLSQAEARIVAYLSGETRLIKVFEEGGDIHRKNASNLYGIKESEVTDEQRQLAKRVIHASHYGMGPITFAKTAEISAQEAKKLLNQYFATYPRIKLWQSQVSSVLKHRRTLTNSFGRRRVFFNRWNETVVKEGLAFLPQSTVADVINQAVVCLHARGVELLLQVHDSILVQCRVEDWESTMEVLHECMTVPIPIDNKTLTIPVDFKFGYNWDEMFKLEKWLELYPHQPTVQ